MKIKQVNEVISKLSDELVKINKKYNSDVKTIFDDDGNFKHIIFNTKTDMNNDELAYFNLYYKPIFYVNFYQEQCWDIRDIIEEIQYLDDAMTEKKIDDYFNNKYQVKDWCFETCVRECADFEEDYNRIDNDDTDLVVSEIIKELKYYLEI